MSDLEPQKSVVLRPGWKQFFIPYLLSVLTMPLLIGIIGFFLVRKKHTELKYEVTDSRIASIDSRYRCNLDLVDIDKVELRQTWLQQKLGIGTLVLITPSIEMEIKGMEQPVQLKQMVERAVEAEKSKLKQQEEIKRPEPKFKPGVMERMDYLTGLWQQGLISNKDFDEEKKNFE